MKNSGFTDEEFKSFIENSFSIAEVLRKMSKVPRGSNYRTVKRRIKKLGLNTDHFKGFGWAKGLIRKELSTDINLYLTNSITCFKPHSLKKKLLEEGYFERKCYVCNLSEWMGQPIPIELDHIDGNIDNNSIENLRIICPNCHAQTPNYKVKNRKDLGRKIYLCECGKNKSKRSIKCSTCRSKYPRKTKIEWPTVEELKSLISLYPFTKIAEKLGVSDNAIRKRCKRLGILPNK